MKKELKVIYYLLLFVIIGQWNIAYELTLIASILLTVSLVFIVDIIACISTYYEK